MQLLSYMLFFFNDTATTEIYTLSLHDALPISAGNPRLQVLSSLAPVEKRVDSIRRLVLLLGLAALALTALAAWGLDRKSTRLNSSHANISYAVFCLKKKKTKRRCVGSSDSTIS